MPMMIDVETKGLIPGIYGLRSIACVMFDYSGNIGPTFFAAVRDPRKWDPATKEWWSRQGDEAERRATENSMPLRQGLLQLTEFIHAYKPVEVWAHGAAFDPPHIEAAYHQANLPSPFNYKAWRDTRTVYGMLGKTPSPEKRPTYVAHDPVQDCIYQIDQLVMAIKELNGA